jgi:hypothetical protein
MCPERSLFGSGSAGLGHNDLGESKQICFDLIEVKAESCAPRQRHGPLGILRAG